MRASVCVATLKKGTAKTGTLILEAPTNRDNSARLGGRSAGNCALAFPAGRRSVRTLQETRESCLLNPGYDEEVRADTC